MFCHLFAEKVIQGRLNRASTPQPLTMGSRHPLSAWGVATLLCELGLAYTFYPSYSQCHKISLVWSLNQSHFLWNICILFITASSLTSIKSAPSPARLLRLQVWRVSNGSSSTAGPTPPHPGECRRTRSPAPCPGQSTPKSSVSQRERDFSPNSGQLWGAILSPEASTGSAKASIYWDTVFPNKCLMLISVSEPASQGP